MIKRRAGKGPGRRNKEIASKRLVVAEHRPWQRWIVLGVSAAVIGIGAWALYNYARSQSHYDWDRYQVERRRLEEDKRRLTEAVEALNDANRELRQEVVLLERTIEIDRESSGQINTTVRELQSELAELRKEVAFYRGIVSPEEARTGVRVHQLRLTRAQEDVYQYELVLIQSTTLKKKVSGVVDLVVQGLEDGKEKTFKYAELKTDADKNLVFSFKYFQQLTGVLRLPEGFIPTRVKIELQRTDKTAEKVESVYDWNKITRPA